MRRNTRRTLLASALAVVLALPLAAPASAQKHWIYCKTEDVQTRWIPMEPIGSTFIQFYFRTCDYGDVRNPEYMVIGFDTSKVLEIQDLTIWWYDKLGRIQAVGPLTFKGHKNIALSQSNPWAYADDIRDDPDWLNPPAGSDTFRAVFNISGRANLDLAADYDFDFRYQAQYGTSNATWWQTDTGEPNLP